MALKLDTYPAWQPALTPVDPREGDMAGIAKTLESIIAAEGPMLMSLAIRRYIHATPDLSRAGGAIRKTMRRAVDRLAMAGTIETATELGGDDENHLLLYLPDQKLMPRGRADRSLQEIPISELAAMMLLVRSARGVSNYTETVQRTLLHALDLVRLTGPTRDRLLTGWRVATRWLEEGNATPRPARTENRPLPHDPKLDKAAKKADRPAPPPGVPSWQAALQGGQFTTRRSDET